MPSADGTGPPVHADRDVHAAPPTALTRVRDGRQVDASARRARPSRLPRSTEWTTTAGRKPSALKPTAARNGNGPSMPTFGSS